MIKLKEPYKKMFEVSNCNGQYFYQNCVKCGYSLKIWCTDWKACPRCGTKNYGRHYGAK
jgi:predicted nucleic-acid-binding Zn-ribbon protein